MSISDETARAAAELRVTISGIVDDETRALVTAWDRAWRDITAEWETAALELAAAGEQATFQQLLRHDRARAAAAAALDQITTLMDRAAVRITNAAGQVIEVTRHGEALQIATQLPRPADTTMAQLVTRFDRVNTDALAWIVDRTTQQVTSRSWPLATEATERMLRSLTQAIPQGLSPRDAARRMLAGVETGFNGGLTRALTIARTEILDAYRAAAAAQQHANADVLAGWVWWAQLDARTCISCVAMHGTEHDLEEQGPEDHQNGRCARMPQVRPWSAFGIATREPPSIVRPGADWFSDQPETVQLAIAGPARLDALRSGRATLDQMSTRRHTTGWRDSHTPTPAARFAA